MRSTKSDIPLALRQAMAEIDTLDRHRGLYRQVDRALARLAAAAARPPCVVFLGEGNSGKTTAANSLLGDGLLPTAVIANTRYPTLVRYSQDVRAVAVTPTGVRFRLSDDAPLPTQQIALIEVGLPNSVLRGFEILDTPDRFDPDDVAALPGLSPLRIPVWCTVATQAWKESERRTWTSLEGRLTRNGILAVTGIDRLKIETDVEKLVARLDAEASIWFSAMALSKGPVTSNHAQEWFRDDAPWLPTVATDMAARLAERRGRTIARLRARILRLAGLSDIAQAGDQPESPWNGYVTRMQEGP